MEIKAYRMAEGSIFINIIAMMSSTSSKLVKTHKVTGNTIIVIVSEKQISNTNITALGLGKIQFKVRQNEADINTIEYVEVHYNNKIITITLN